MRGETALECLFSTKPAIQPRRAILRRRNRVFLIVGYEHGAYIHAFIANVSGAALKESRDLSLTKSAKRTTQWRRDLVRCLFRCFGDFLKRASLLKRPLLGSR